MKPETYLIRYLARLERRIQQLTQQDAQLSQSRLSSFGGGLVLALILSRVEMWLGGVVFGLTLVGFGVLVYHHRRVRATLYTFQIWQKIKQTHLARLNLAWEQLPAPRTAPDLDHPFGADLDLVGKQSVHHLLDTCVSPNGSDRLQNWLLSPTPELVAIHQRQKLVAELRPRRYFRDQISLQARLISADWHGDLFLKWLTAPQQQVKIEAGLLGVLLSLAGINGIGFLLASAGSLPPLWGITWVIFLAISAVYWRKTSHLFSEILTIDRQLAQLNQIFRRLEKYPAPPALAELLHPFHTDRPSQQLHRLNRLTLAASLQSHGMIWTVLNFTLPWQIGVAYLLYWEKKRLGEHLSQWLEVFYDVESLNALANFADLNPVYTFPQFTPDQVHLKATALGHPLIPTVQKVCNDVQLTEAARIFILTGSNMSGKSSFLRTLGVNLALAYAGGVVDAEQLAVSQFRLFTCIRVSDSLIDGFSYFYAEVRRLKSLLDAAQTEHNRPLFFLIDEIFRGTNNQERLIGSRAYIQALTETGSFGLVATHDLELTHLADQHPAIHNYHFREEVIGQEMVFDYRLRAGASPTTNALKIMQLVGLPVETS